MTRVEWFNWDHFPCIKYITNWLATINVIISVPPFPLSIVPEQSTSKYCPLSCSVLPFFLLKESEDNTGTVCYTDFWKICKFPTKLARNSSFILIAVLLLPFLFCEDSDNSVTRTCYANPRILYLAQQNVTIRILHWQMYEKRNTRASASSSILLVTLPRKFSSFKKDIHV